MVAEAPDESLVGAARRIHGADVGIEQEATGAACRIDLGIRDKIDVDGGDDGVNQPAGKSVIAGVATENLDRRQNPDIVVGRKAGHCCSQAWLTLDELITGRSRAP